MVLVDIWPYFHSFRLGNKGQENMFYNILERKTPFLATKTRSWKGRKIAIFPSSLWFWSKIGHFFLVNIGQENFSVYNMLERKKAFLGYKN